MSGLLAISRSVLASRHRLAVACLDRLGGDESGVWSGDDASVMVTRKTWELGCDFSDRVLVLETPSCVVGADASLYHRADLVRALSAAGISLTGTSPSHLIAAAYQLWGESLVDHIEGDYAFVIWDRRRQRLIAARDPLGSRPLYFARVGKGVAIASSSKSLAELIGGTGNLNLATLGTQVAGLAWALGTDSSFKGVESLAPGHRLAHEQCELHVSRFWHPPAAPDQRPVGAEQAAEELRLLLGNAVTQRLSRDLTTVWMSGGWDSTAVFAAGEHALAPSDRSRLRPVSISYPLGDPGREDEIISRVASHWKADVRWLRSDDIPLLEGLAERAARADEPPAHLYELWNRQLARTTRDAGARVTLDGGGGDQLFQVSDVALAARLQKGELVEFARLATSRRGRGWRHLARASVLPLLPESLLRAAGRWMHRPIPRHYFERSVADWMRPEFVEREELRERDLAVLRRVRAKDLAHAESMMYLTLPVWSHGASYMRGALLEEGVEVRSPLLDLRLVEFALRRPVSERASPGETKTLLRKSMSGLLPADVLAPRKFRTGMTYGFSKLRMREAYPALVAQLLSEPLRLADLGMVEPAKLRAAAERCSAGRADEAVQVNLFHAMKVEFWLRGLDAPAAIVSAARKQHGARVAVPAA